MDILASSLFSGTGSNQSGMIMVAYVVIIGAFLYFVMYRPQQKEKKRVSSMLSSLAKGDSILTTSGFYGVIIDIPDESTVIVEFGNNKNCRIPMQKSAIAQVEKSSEK